MPAFGRSGWRWMVVIAAAAAAIPAVLAGPFTLNGTQPPLTYTLYPPVACSSTDEVGAQLVAALEILVGEVAAEEGIGAFMDKRMPEWSSD